MDQAAALEIRTTQGASKGGNSKKELLSHYRKSHRIICPKDVL